MADHYSQATVSPVLPVALVTDFEKILLNEYGFNFYIDGPEHERNIYFYVPDGERDSVEGFDIDFIESSATLGDEIAVALQQYINENGEGEIDQFISSQYTWVSIFQHILDKPGCQIDEIIVEGAYYCDKFRQSAFGGWITRITKFTVQSSGTQAMLVQMHQEREFLDALDIVYQLASANCADNEHDPDDPHLDECLADDCRKQRAALNLIHDYCANHELNS